jgi:N-acetyl-1-D-myo-inositol-2-amino-2-deoxy-alpha-D-glucopyranoside deacetylase
MADLRILFVHAHPDDESIETGATMAKYVAEGAHVCLVTCTRGEEGDIVPEELRHLDGDALGEYRVGELARACAALGVTDHRFLGGPGRFRDSGMEWDPAGHARPKPTVRDDTFWKADLTEAADLLVEIIREVRPQVLVTYDEFGNYGHPDHVQAHRVAMYAALLAAVPSYRLDLGEPWDIAKIYWTALSLSRLREEAALMAERGIENPFEGFDLDNPPKFMVDDDAIACEVVAIVREVRPQVIVTYDANGFYGHPDHIQAHRVAWRAFERAADPSFGAGAPWRPSRFYATAVPLSVLEEGAGRGPFQRVESVSDFGFGVPDGQVTTRVDARDHLPAKEAAMRAHRTQLTVDPPYFALSNDIGQPLSGVEYYTLLAGEPGPLGEDGRESGFGEPVA